MGDIDTALAEIVQRLKQAKRIAVLTGAGMSAASGLPTYRGIGGLYNDIEIEQGMPIEEILHARTLVSNPALCWKYIAQIGAACQAAGPNPGHDILAQWERLFEVHVITQNVDGFHRRAGSTAVIELHGNLTKLNCVDCATCFSPDDFDFKVLPPRCHECDGLVRPGAVLFGELLPGDALDAYGRELERGFDVMFAIGTTAAFPYIHEPMISARAKGVSTVEINPDQTTLSTHVDWHIAMPAVEALSLLNDALA